MAEIALRANCVHHDDRLAVATCDACGRHVCAACRTDGVHVGGEFCSVACRDRAERAEAEALLEGLESPFQTGWALWRGAAMELTRHVAPVALVITAAFALDAWFNPLDPLTDPAEATVILPTTMIVIAGLVFGVLVTQTVLSKAYTGIIRGNVYAWAARRLIPWALAWLLLLLAISVGFVLLIVPGVILSLRLFWADEFALAHRCGPIASLRESWELTRGQMGAVFTFQLLAGVAAWAVMVVGLVVVTVLQAVLVRIGTAGAFLSVAVLFTLAFIGYAAVHAPEVAKFYGVRAAKLLGVAAGEPVRLGLSRAPLR